MDRHFYAASSGYDLRCCRTEVEGKTHGVIQETGSRGKQSAMVDEDESRSLKNRGIIEAGKGFDSIQSMGTSYVWKSRRVSCVY